MLSDELSKALTKYHITVRAKNKKFIISKDKECTLDIINIQEFLSAKFNNRFKYLDKNENEFELIIK